MCSESQFKGKICKCLVLPSSNQTPTQQRLGFPKGKSLWQHEEKGWGHRGNAPKETLEIGNLLPSQKKVHKGNRP